MFVKLRRAISAIAHPATKDARASREDPFETIKKALSSVSDQFNQLGNEFEPVAKLEVDPKALPAKKKSRTTSPTSKAREGQAKAVSREAATEVSVKTSSAPAKKPAATKTSAVKEAGTSSRSSKTAVAKSNTKARTVRTPSPKPTSTEKPAAN